MLTYYSILFKNETNFQPTANKNWKKEQKQYKRTIKSLLNSQTTDKEIKWRKDHDLKMIQENEKIKDASLYFVKRKKKTGALL